MTAYINGVAVVGSLEEIAKLLGIKLDDSSYTITDSNAYAISQKCKNCPHQGEGCNPQFCL